MSKHRAEITFRHGNERARAMIDAEAQMMGRPCNLVDFAELAEGVAVIVYRTDPLSVPQMNGRAMSQTRVATYAGERNMGSSVIGTEWTDV